MTHSARLRLVTALPRRIDAVLCAGSVANAARSVADGQRRALQRQDAAAAVRRLEGVHDRASSRLVRAVPHAS